MQSSASFTKAYSCVARRLESQGSVGVSYTAQGSFPRRLGHHIASGKRRRHDHDDVEGYAQEQHYEQGVSPTPPPTLQERRIPLVVSIPGVLLVTFLVLRVLKKLQSRG